MWFRSAANSSGSPGRRGGLSILGAGFRVNGDIACPGEVHISGTLIGNLSADKVTLGEGGSINGAVEAETAIINGALQGRLAAVNVILGRTAQVNADVVYCSMRIEPGAAFEGFSRRVERDQIQLAGAGEAPLLPPLKSLRDTTERSSASGAQPSAAE